MLSDRVAAKEVARLLQGLQTSLKERGVKPENMRVQLESELLASLDIPPKKLVQWAEQKLGLKLILLDWREKARQSYLGCIGVLPSKVQSAKHLVISIEDLQATLSVGQGLSWSRELTAQLSLGMEQLFLENPTDLIDVALARNEVTQKLDAFLSVQDAESLSGRYVYLTWHETNNCLFEMDAKRRPGGFGMQRTGLDAFLVHWYLGQSGLLFLQQQVRANVLTLEQARLLVKRLVILSELAKRLEISIFHFGSENGLGRVVFDELAKQQIVRNAQIFGTSLAEQAKNQYALVEEMLRKIFPTQNIKGRIKTRTSIIDKLARKALRTQAPVYPMRNIREAAALVSDGVGFCLVLENATQHSIETICDSLVYALRNEHIQILELKNYRGTGSQALPYLTGMDIHRIQRCVQAQENHPPFLVQDDVRAVKASGYTTAQCVLLFKNPQTGAFDLPPCELQIRGKMVDAFYAIEHCIRDIRLGKRDVLQENDLTQERIALFDAASQLEQEPFEILLSYLNAYYEYCRRLESQLPATVPQKPKSLADIFDLNRLFKLETPTKLPEPERLPIPGI